MPLATTSNNDNKDDTPSEPLRPPRVTRTMSNTLGISSKNERLVTTAFDSPLPSVQQGSSDNSTYDESGIVSPALVQEAGHGHLGREMPASSALAVHGSVPPSPFMQQFGALAHGVPRRGNKGTKVDTPIWQRAGLTGHAEAKSGAVEDEGADDGVDQAMQEDQVVDDLALTAGTRNGRVIAVDFDDVCCQCMVSYFEGHNELWGTDLTVDDMESYFIHQNKGWGTLAETNRKIQQLEQGLSKTLPALGHPIHIVTARHERCKGQIVDWLAEQGITVGFGPEDTIAVIWTTNAFGLDSSKSSGADGASSKEDQETTEIDDVMDQTMQERKHNAHLQKLFKAQVAGGGSGKRKLQVLRGINASLFIDDHHGNLEPIVQSQPQIPCLLFGKYAWNMHRSGGETPVELMSHQERVDGGLELPKREIELVDGLERAETWEDVIKWVEAWDERDAQREQ